MWSACAVVTTLLACSAASRSCCERTLCGTVDTEAAASHPGTRGIDGPLAAIKKAVVV